MLLCLGACGHLGFDRLPDGDGGPDSSGGGRVECVRKEHVIAASNVTTSLASAADSCIAVSGTWYVNTDNGAIVDGMGTPIRAAGTALDAGLAYAQEAGGGGAALGVLAMQTLYVPSDATLVAFGTRALVLLVDGDVLIEGRVSVAAADAPAGTVAAAASAGGVDVGVATPGIGPGGGQQGGTGAGCEETGGGGGGFGSVGGAGGNRTGTNNLYGAKGPAYGTAALEPLFGGSGGGAGVDYTNTVFATGGTSGGALQLTAQGELVIAASGIIDASGGGGGGGNQDASCTGGAGGGGGSGGGLLFEAAHIVVAGIIGANGGGGGSGGSNSAAGGSGGGGSALVVPASGATMTGTDGGRGGNGSDAAGLATNGMGNNGGGGGGGAGRIRFNTLVIDFENTAAIAPSQASGLATIGPPDTP
jgi:hypothetical protein